MQKFDTTTILRTSKEEVEAWRKEAELEGFSKLSKYIRAAVAEKMARDRRIREYAAKVRGEFADDDTELK